jgi:hypothetical protein
VRGALEDVRSRIARGHADTRCFVGTGLARAFGGGLLYADDGAADAAPAGRPAPLPRAAEELAAEVVGRHLGLDTLRAGPGRRAPAHDPAAAMMAAWLQPRE